jgi:hypothetical protein
MPDNLLSKEGFRVMEADESAVAAHEHVGRHGWSQIPATTRYRQYYRVTVAVPVDPLTRWALKLCPRVFKRREYPLNVVLTAVSFHADSLPRSEG